MLFGLELIIRHCTKSSERNQIAASQQTHRSSVKLIYLLKQQLGLI